MRVFKVILFVQILDTIFALLTFSNIKCISYDKAFADFEDCHIKAINRSLKLVSGKVRLHQMPITNASMSFGFQKRDNGWKNFFYNYTVDACQFMKMKRQPIIREIVGVIAQYSNMNHTWPFDHDLIIRDLPTTQVERIWTHILPIMRGDYLVRTIWSAYGLPRCETNLYMTFSYITKLLKTYFVETVKTFTYL